MNPPLPPLHYSGLSSEARKRVTIAVELVADPRILFMDEPTSGLDTAGALNVMRVGGLALCEHGLWKGKCQVFYSLPLMKPLLLFSLCSIISALPPYLPHVCFYILVTLLTPFF